MLGVSLDNTFTNNESQQSEQKSYLFIAKGTFLDNSWLSNEVYPICSIVILCMVSFLIVMTFCIVSL